MDDPPLGRPARASLRRARRLTLALGLLACGAADAHGFREGGPYDRFLEGLSLPWSTPEGALLILSCGAMIGLWRSGSLSRVLPFLAGGALLGTLASMLPFASPITWPLSVLAVITAGLAVAARPWPRRLVGALTFVAAGSCALTPLMDHVWGEVPVAVLIGSFASVNLSIILVNNVIALTCRRFPQPWIAIGFRVAGSWLCAVAILLLAVTLRR